MVCLIWFFFWFGNLPSEIEQKCLFLFQLDASSPRRRSVRLSEPEVLNFPVSASPRRRLLCLGEGLRLGDEDLFRLGESEVLFLFISSINPRNH